MGEKYLQRFSACGSNAESQPGTQEGLRSMDLAVSCKVALRPPTFQSYKTWTRLWTTWKLSS